MAGSRWHAVAALVDPVRRALYDYVRRQRRAVTREEAAHAQSISRSLTAFHLDKLVDSGLLRARYETPAGRPRGRGRVPKVYEPTGDLAVTVPPRRYDLVGEILADAVAATVGAAEAAQREGYARGRTVGNRIAGADRPAAGAPAAETLDAAWAALADLGFEPRRPEPAPESGPVPGSGPVPVPGSGPVPALVLANCPFHALAERQRELVCGINHAFVRGLLVGLGTERLAARLAPRPGACCVEIVAPAG